MYSRRQAIAVAGLGIAAISGCTDVADFATGSGPLSETAQPAAINEQTLSETDYSLANRDTLEIDEEVEAGGETRRVTITNQIATYERPVDLAEAVGGSVTSGSTDADDVDQEDVPDDADPEDIPDDLDEEDLPDDVDPEDLPNAVDGGIRPATAAQTTADSAGTATPRQIGGTDSASSVFVAFTTPAFEILGQSLNPLGQLDNKALATELAGQVGQLSVGDEQSTTSTSVLDAETTVSTFAGTLSQSGAEIDVEIMITSVINEEDYVIGFGVYPQLLADSESAAVSELLDGLEHPVSTQ